jgi:N-acetylmuramoyl-L-alanine amidase
MKSCKAMLTILTDCVFCAAVILLVSVGTTLQAQQTSHIFTWTDAPSTTVTNKQPEISLTNCRKTPSGLTLESKELSVCTIHVSRIETELAEATPFLTFSARLNIRDADAKNIRVFVRGTASPARATSQLQQPQAWKALAFDDHADDGSEVLQDGILTTQLAFLPEGTRAVELKIELRRSVLYREPQLQECRVFFFNPGRTVRNQTVQAEEISQENKVRAETQGDAYPRPAFVSRTEWGCPWGQGSGPNTLVSTAPTHLIVHHSFSPGNDVTDWKAAMRGIWNYHVNSNRWSDIGYNWLIDPNGTIYQGRAWVGEDDNTQGAHFCGYNRATMGVCMLGDFNTVLPTAAALKSLVRLLAYRASNNTLNALGSAYHENSMRTLARISGHRDGCATDCPGSAFYPTLPVLRSRVFALLNPPTVQNVSASVVSPRSLECVARVQPNASETNVFIEWDTIAPTAATPRLRNRQFMRTFTATDTAAFVTATLVNLSSDAQVIYRFVAENSDTLAVSEERTVRLTRTGVHQRAATSFSATVVPNPGSSETVFSYVLPAAAFVRLRLFNASGTLVREVFAGQQSSGLQQHRLDCSDVASGLYYIDGQVFGEQVQSRCRYPLMVIR